MFCHFLQNSPETWTSCTIFCFLNVCSLQFAQEAIVLIVTTKTHCFWHLHFLFDSLDTIHCELKRKILYEEKIFNLNLIDSKVVALWKVVRHFHFHVTEFTNLENQRHACEVNRESVWIALRVIELEQTHLLTNANRSGNEIARSQDCSL